MAVLSPAVVQLILHAASDDEIRTAVVGLIAESEPVESINGVRYAANYDATEFTSALQNYATSWSPVVEIVWLDVQSRVACANLPIGPDIGSGAAGDTGGSGWRPTLYRGAGRLMLFMKHPICYHAHTHKPRLLRR